MQCHNLKRPVTLNDQLKGNIIAKSYYIFTQCSLHFLCKENQTTISKNPIFDAKNGIILRSHTSRKWVMSKFVWHKNMKNKLQQQKPVAINPERMIFIFDWMSFHVFIYVQMLWFSFIKIFLAGSIRTTPYIYTYLCYVLFL